MNKTGIEYCDYTWNPATGCEHGCNYCYARKIAERFKGGKAFPNGFKPTFHPERLNDPAKMKAPQSIFVCSMADLFGEWVPAYWIWDTFEAMDSAPQHTYIMLTKNPKKMASFAPERGDQPRGIQKNWWFGTSVTCREDTHRIDTLQNRIGGDNKFISFEPLLGDPGPLDLTGIKQVIVGTQTNPTIVPPSEAIRSVVLAAANASAKVFFKDSMNGVPWRGQSTFVNVRDLWWDVHK